MHSAVQESALAVLLPEAEALVGPFRSIYDPAARMGVPAHITVLYPFVPPAQIAPPIEKSLQTLFASLAAFDFALAEIREFPGVLYLAPTLDVYFRELTAAVYEQFPAYPPYAGAIADPIPHLTVGQTDDPLEFDRLRTTFARQAKDKLPIPARAAQVALLDNRLGKWRTRTVFRLGA
jgi:2'-5' RNA ligase